MAIQMTVPTVGESIQSVFVSEWVKNEGDFVERDEIIMIIDSEKSSFEVRATASGTLRQKCAKGDELAIGALICEIEESASSQKQEAPVVVKQEVSTETKLVDVILTPVGESITEGTLVAWNKQEGDRVELDEVICSIETDKITVDVRATAAGILHPKAKAGEVVPIGSLLAQITAGASATVQNNTKVETTQVTDNQNYATGHMSPAANKLLSEKGIDAKDVKGTGKDGRITKEDAMNAEKKAVVNTTPEKKEVKAENNAPVLGIKGSRATRREKMTSLRRTISKRLVAVKNETAMLTTFNEVDLKAIMDIRAKFKDKFKEKFGVGLGFMSFFSKACALALKEFPAVNAMIDGNDIVFNDFVDISIAVSTPKGLVVPVVRNVEDMSLDQIEKEIGRLAVRARDGQLTIPEMTGGTFTITNGGVFGSLVSTPIINAPQSAILGMHNIVERPIAINGQVVIRPMMYIALSYDHRIIDGKDSVSFLVRVKELLESPERMLLGV